MTHPPRQCTARFKDGRRCRSWALRDGVEALCTRHTKAGRQELPTQARPLRLYDDACNVKEAADLLHKTQFPGLGHELNITRLVVLRTLLLLQQELDPAEFARLAALIFKGVRTIAAIMRIQHSLPAAENEPFDKVHDQAIARVVARHRTEPSAPSHQPPQFPLVPLSSPQFRQPPATSHQPQFRRDQDIDQPTPLTPTSEK